MRKLFGIGGCGAVALAAFAGFGQPARATLITLTDLNSTVNFDTQSQLGMYDWYVDGVDHMYQQWFWYRVGSTGPEASLDTLTQVGAFAVDTNPFTDQGVDVLTVLYRGAGFDVEVKYSLQGGNAGSNISDVGEQIKITNTGERALDFHFFQYSDFDLNGSALDQSISITGGNTATQTDGASYIGETVVTPAPNQYAVGTFSAQRDSLNDGVATNLGAVGGPLSNMDLTWAFQWDINLGVGQSFSISKDKHVSVPAPGAALLGVMGLGLIRATRRRLA